MTPKRKTKKVSFLKKALITAAILGLAGFFKEDSKITVTLPDKINNIIDPIDLAAPLTAPLKVIDEMGEKLVQNSQKTQNEAVNATRNKRPMKNVLANDEADMPPWEHPHKWGKISSEHGTCWHHYDTMRKVCQ